MASSIIIAEQLGKQYQVARAGASAQASLRFSEMLAARFRQPWFRPVTNVDAFWALKDVSFSVAEGEVVGIIGRNGAGKSTLLKILSRITEPSCGRIRLRGRVASLLEVGTGFHPELTGRENIFLNGAILGLRRGEILRQFDAIVDFAGTERFLDMPVKRYSSGMYVRLAFAVAAHLEAEILVVDEVLAVGDAAFQQKCIGKMSTVASSGRTVLFVSHNLAVVQRLCQQGILLEEGRVVRQGEIRDVVDHYSRTTMQAAPNTAARRAINRHLGISLDAVRVEREGEDLLLQARLESTNPVASLGPGVRVMTAAGDRVAELKPFKTGLRLPGTIGVRKFQIRLEEFFKRLPEGRYSIDMWLADPGVEVFLDLAAAALVEVPANDHYSTGHSLQQNDDGLVLLHATLHQGADLNPAARDQTPLNAGSTG